MYLMSLSIADAYFLYIFLKLFYTPQYFGCFLPLFSIKTYIYFINTKRDSIKNDALFERVSSE